MKKVLTLFMLLGAMASANAQRVLSLDSCRQLALDNNKQLAISRINKEMATSAHKAVKTKYLPKLDATGTYQYMSREVSILNERQKNALSNFGTNFATNLTQEATTTITDLTMKGILTRDQAQQLSGLLQQLGMPVATALNEAGDKIRDAFRTDTRNFFGGALTVRQPIYMGGAITAANKIATLGERMADEGIESRTQATIYEIDKAYWLIVSLKQKQKLADSFYNLIEKLDGDVKKMIDEGVATKADGLKVAVKLNEAEMAKNQVEDGLVLARMLLCQLCGIDMETDIKLADEDCETIAIPMMGNDAATFDLCTRPELRMLETAVDISKQNTRLVRAAFLPQVAAFGGYMISNPNIYNGFEKKFGGIFHVGVMFRVPVWNWFEGRHTVNATRAASKIAQYELDDAREKMQLLVKQNRFKIKEANHRLALAEKSVQSADENLRCANIGFKEGVIPSTDIIAAQAAWMKAHTQKIDAQIDVRMAKVELDRSEGRLQ